MTIWDKLNELQQRYLKAIFHCDQAKEQERARRFRSGRGSDHQLASEWRMMSYEEVLEEVGERPSGEDVDEILIDLGCGGLIEREEDQDPAEGHPRLQITRAGRKVVRQALGITREEFTEEQRRFIKRIVSAGFAPQAVVEAAFRDHKEGSRQIEAWRQALKGRARAAFAEEQRKYQEHLASLTRFEPCSYPGCSENIEVRTIAIGGRVTGNEEEPKPVRFIDLVEQLPGWHEETLGGITVRVPNTRTTRLDLYACSPAHREGVYRLTGQVRLHLDQAEERRLQFIVYPWASEEARLAIWLRGASDALDYVAQAPLGTTFPSPKAWARIKVIGQACLAVFKANTMAEPANTGKQFTDDEAALIKRYLDMFRLEFKSGLTIRDAILAPRPGSFPTSFRDQPRWRPLYDLVAGKVIEPL